MSTKVYPMGSIELTVPASGKISVYSRAPVKVYNEISNTNQPNTFNLLKMTASGEEYLSAAVTLATRFRVEAGADEVFVNVGTAATVTEKRSNQRQIAPIALNATGALTAAAILSGIVTSSTAAAVSGTVPTGTVLDAAFQMDIDDSIDFSVIATGANAFTVVVAAGVTAVGTMIVATVTAGRFRLRKTAAATYIIYRMG